MPADLEDVLWAVARERLPVGALQPRALAEAVAALSQRYTTGRAALARAAAPGSLAARLLFFTPTDAPKVEVPLGELAAVTPLPAPLAVLDLGAGTGAMTLGLLAALRRQGTPRDVAVTAVDRDAAALGLLGAVVARAGAALAPLRARVAPLAADLAAGASLPPGPFDLVLAGSVLNELGGADAVRRRADLVLAAADRLAPGGAVIVVEPALRETARALEEVRARILDAGLTVFAPCPHAGACPMLARERDWCHEARRLALSPRALSLSRATGLRQAEARFAYLTVRRGGPTLAAARGASFRVVSHPLPAKGMVALELCGAGRRVRAELLTRHLGSGNRDFADAGRGDLLALEPPPGVGERWRLGAEDQVRRR